ncbi:regulatory protein RecX [Colwelliaceae bacterium BS250]
MAYTWKQKTVKKEYPVTPERIFNYSTWLLQRADQTLARLTQKLNFKFNEHPQWVSDCIKKLEEMDYVNDARYIEGITDSLLNKNIGINKIKQKLYEKQFPKDLIEQISEKLTEADYSDKAMELVSNKFKDKPIDDYKIKVKAQQFLVTRGFSFKEAMDTVNQYMLEQNKEEDYE